MTLTRWCCIFLAIALAASLFASIIGRPDMFAWLALVLGSAAASYLTRVDPLKGAALALMALRAAVIVVVDMAQDAGSTFLDRYRGRWHGAKDSIKEWD